MAHAPIVERSDNRKGIIAAVLMMLITLFILFFIKYHEPDPPKVTVPIPITMAEDGIDEFEIYNAGGGAPSESVNETVEPQVSPEEQPTQDESAVVVPSGSGDASSETSTSESSQPASPFGGSGSGGSGTSGSGGGFGSDTGPGTGSGEAGTGAAGDRVRLSNITSKPKTPNSNLCEIALKLTIDSRGYVVAASIVRANTTTTNQALIDEVIKLTKKEVRYEERPNSKNETAFYTVTVKPS